MHPKRAREKQQHECHTNNDASTIQSEPYWRAIIVELQPHISHQNESFRARDPSQLKRSSIDRLISNFRWGNISQPVEPVTWCMIIFLMVMCCWSY